MPEDITTQSGLSDALGASFDAGVTSDNCGCTAYCWCPCAVTDLYGTYLDVGNTKWSLAHWISYAP